MIGVPEDLNKPVSVEVSDDAASCRTLPASRGDRGQRFEGGSGYAGLFFIEIGTR